MEGNDMCIPNCPCWQCQQIPQPLYYFAASSSSHFIPPCFPSNCQCNGLTTIGCCSIPCSSTCPHKPPSPSPPPSPPSPTPPLPPASSKKRMETCTQKRQQKKDKDEFFGLREMSRREMKLSGVKYPINPDAKKMPWSKPTLYLMGFQGSQVITWTTMIIPILLAPIMGGGDLEKAETIQSALFMTGINTLLQIWFGSRLPVVMQISEAFTIPAINIALSTKNTCSCTVNPRQRFKRTMRRIQGASIIVSFVQVIIGFLGLPKYFVSRISDELLYLVNVPFVTLTGLGLYNRGIPQLTKCIEIGVPALVLLVFSRQFLSRFWKSGTKIAERYSATNSIIIVWILAEILSAGGAYDNTSQQTQLNCRANRGGQIRAAPWIKIPRPFQWGYPTFEAGDVFSMMAACFVAIIESSSTFVTSSRFSGGYRIPAPRISEAIGVQGIGTLLDAVFGLGLGSTASVQHAGLVGSTQIGTRRIAIISAIFMILISLIGKLAVVLASIPLPIVGALYIAFFPYVVAGGLDDFILCDLKSFRSKSILGFSVFMGLSVPQYFSNYDLFSTDGLPQTSSNWFKIIMVVILSSPPTVGTIIAFLFYFTPKPPPPPPPPPSPPPPPKKEDLKEGPPKPKASEPLDKAKPLPHVPPPVKSKEMKAEDETEEMKKQIRLEIKKTYKRPSSLSDLFS